MTYPSRSTGRLAVIALLALAVALSGCTGVDSPAPISRRPAPPIDREAPSDLETATFASG